MKRDGEAGAENPSGLRRIEFGPLRIYLEREEDPVPVLQSLMRPLSNQELADMLGISERTVRRWKQSGKLPNKGNVRLKLADLLLAGITPDDVGWEGKTAPPLAQT